MKVFISGPMSGKPNGNKEAFFEAEYKLKGLGYSVFNPAWCRYGVVTEFTADDMHMIDFSALSRCDAIYMLKGWQYSIGARAEYEHAKALGKEILIAGHPVKDPLKWGKESEKNTPVFDREFAYDEAIKNRTNYQLEAIKENVKEKYDILDGRIKSIEEELAWDKWKNDLPDICCSNRIDLVEKKYKDLAEDVEDCKKEDERIDIIFGNHADKINSLDSEVEAIKESIGTDDLQGQLDKDFKDVYNEFQSVKDMVNDINFGYIDWSSKMSSAIEHIEETRKHVMSFYDGEFIDTFNKVDERLKKLEKTVNGLNSIVGELGKRSDSTSEDLSIWIKNVDALNNRLVETLEKTVNGLEYRLKKIENLVADTDVDYLEARVRGLEETFKTEPKSKGKKA